MQFSKKEYKKFSKGYKAYVLAGDIGGTNCTLGIFGITKRLPELLASFHFKSRELTNLYEPINTVMKYANKQKGIKIKKCCLGIAGALSIKRDYVKLTNAKLHASTSELSKKTGLRKIIFMNDFEAAGYGISMLSGKGIKTIKKGHKVPKSPIVVIGAGTGLGKTTMIYDNEKGIYIPLPSEIHHADFPAQSKIESELVEFIKRAKKTKNVSNGDILSGEGLENIYLFLRKSGKFRQTGFTKEIDKSRSKPELISKYRKNDIICRKTFEMFRDAYAGFAKGCALDSLPFNGVYIAGGIAAKNQDMFNKQFIKEFENSHLMKQVLKRIPVYLITNQDAGLLGAGFAGAKMLR